MMHKRLFFLFSGFLLLFATACPLLADTEAKTFKVVIDAGHGGHDAGAIGAKSKEKDLNLRVALAFGKLVEANCPDVTVIYTRKSDKFIPLQERADIANRAKADLFISIHTNSLPAGRVAYGTETYTLGMARASANLDVAKRENAVILYEKDYKTRYSGFDPNSSESYIIFEFMQDQYMRQSVSLARAIERAYDNTAGRKSRGVHQAGFLVLRNTSMPSVLTEIGFISTPTEENFLNSEEGIRKTAQSIYEGFVAYKKTQDGNRTLLQPFVNTDSDDNKRKGATGKDKPTPADIAAETQTTDNAADTPTPAPPANKKDKTRTSAAQSDETDRPTDSTPVFRVQLFASSRKLNSNSAQFQGLSPVDVYEEGGLYKYTYGETSNYNEILKRQSEARTKFPKAFVVALKNGKRIDINTARRELQNQ